MYAEIANGTHGRIMTTDFVLDEAATFVRLATDVATAATLLRRVTAAPNVTVAWIDAQHFRDALVEFERHTDKRWSFTDCTSFVVMKERRLREALTTDGHFVQAGFRIVPD